MKLASGVLAASLALGLALAPPAVAQEREYIFVVGSSTVYPFATVAAEWFGRKTEFRTPKVEQTGSGGGLQLFCAGLGAGTPDIATASRRIAASEIKQCATNGVDQIVEIVIGRDGIVLANAKDGPQYDFSLQDLYFGLAKDVPDPDAPDRFVANPYETWAAVSPDLEDAAIKVYGPSPVHGTYDAFLELAMEGGCRTLPSIAALASRDSDRFEAICDRIRQDGRYIEVSGDYNLVIGRMRGDPQALGIVGFNFLDQNRDLIQGAGIEGVAPTLEHMVSGDYPLTRELYLYVKKAHVGNIPGLQAFVQEFTSDAAAGDWGYLEQRGLIPLPPAEHRKMQRIAATMRPLEDG